MPFKSKTPKAPAAPKEKKKNQIRKVPARGRGAPAFIDLPRDLTPPAGTTTGCYIRSLIMLDRFTFSEIIEKVRKHFPDSVTGRTDVSWNRSQLAKAGAAVPAKRPEQGEPEKAAKGKKADKATKTGKAAKAPKARAKAKASPAQPAGAEQGAA